MVECVLCFLKTVSLCGREREREREQRAALLAGCQSQRATECPLGANLVICLPSIRQITCPLLALISQHSSPRQSAPFQLWLTTDTSISLVPDQSILSLLDGSVKFLYELSWVKSPNNWLNLLYYI